jgi:hypothetical protein
MEFEPHNQTNTNENEPPATEVPHHFDVLLADPKVMAGGPVELCPFNAMAHIRGSPLEMLFVLQMSQMHEHEQNKLPNQHDPKPSSLSSHSSVDAAGSPPLETQKPTPLMVVNKEQGQMGQHHLLEVLLDIGSDKTMFHRESLPNGASPQRLVMPQVGNALAGTFHSSQRVWLEDLLLAEFGNSRRTEQQEALVFNADCPCDAILGLDFLTLTGIDICLSNQTICWMGKTVPMKD